MTRFQSSSSVKHRGRDLARRVSHHGRSPVRQPVPVYAACRTRHDVRGLRGKALFRQLLISFRRYHEKRGFRLIGFHVRGDEVELIVEADDTAALSRGMQGLGVSMAKRINFTTGRSGAAFEDRFYARELRTAREVADAFARVAPNDKGDGGQMAYPYSSTAFKAGLTLVAAPRTWLMCVGWLCAANIDEEVLEFPLRARTGS